MPKINTFLSIKSAKQILIVWKLDISWHWRLKFSRLSKSVGDGLKYLDSCNSKQMTMGWKLGTTTPYDAIIWDKATCKKDDFHVVDGNQLFCVLNIFWLYKIKLHPLCQRDVLSAQFSSLTSPTWAKVNNLDLYPLDWIILIYWGKNILLQTTQHYRRLLCTSETRVVDFFFSIYIDYI